MVALAPVRRKNTSTERMGCDKSAQRILKICTKPRSAGMRRFSTRKNPELDRSAPFPGGNGRRFATEN